MQQKAKIVFGFGFHSQNVAHSLFSTHETKAIIDFDSTGSRKQWNTVTCENAENFNK